MVCSIHWTRKFIRCRYELFINNGDLTFTERAAEFGLDDPGYSIHGAFFDYDKDNDLDFYLGNNSYKAIGSFELRNNLRTDAFMLFFNLAFLNSNKIFMCRDGITQKIIKLRF